MLEHRRPERSPVATTCQGLRSKKDVRLFCATPNDKCDYAAACGKTTETEHSIQFGWQSKAFTTLSLVPKSAREGGSVPGAGAPVCRLRRCAKLAWAMPSLPIPGTPSAGPPSQGTPPPPDPLPKGPPLPRTAQNVAFCFFLFSAANFVLSSLSAGLLVELWPRFEATDSQVVRLGSLGSFCARPSEAPPPCGHPLSKFEPPPFAPPSSTGAAAPVCRSGPDPPFVKSAA